MKSTLYFIVEVQDDYNNYEKLSNGLEIMVNNSIESVENVNRIGKVLSAPNGTKAKEGDFLLFHHNICRKEHGFKGKKRLSPFQVNPNIFFVPVTEVFMHKEEGGQWESVDPFIFIKPLESIKIKLDNGVEVEENSYKGQAESYGEVAFVNKKLAEEGVSNGDIIAFEEESQHEYVIDGELYYKMQTSDILAVY